MNYALIICRFSLAHCQAMGKRSYLFYFVHLFIFYFFFLFFSQIGQYKLQNAYKNKEIYAYYNDFFFNFVDMVICGTTHPIS